MLIRMLTGADNQDGRFASRDSDRASDSDVCGSRWRRIVSDLAALLAPFHPHPAPLPAAPASPHPALSRPDS